MKEIIVSRPENDNFLEQLKALYRTFNQVSFGDQIKFNLSNLTWVHPLLALPISAYIQKTNSECDLDECNVRSYLRTVDFPKGVRNVSTFQKRYQREKTYTPIGVLTKHDEKSREELQSLFYDKIYEVIGAISGTKNTVIYPVSELVGNIFEHSGSNKGFLFGQFYPLKEYLDICIADCGCGISKTYKNELNLELTDEEAIKKALQGHSTKTEEGDRGYGVRTSKKIICEALEGGKFVIISGSSGMITSGTEDKYFNFPNWNGVIVAYRIPKPTNPINIYDYIE